MNIQSTYTDKTILVIDDEAFICDILQTCLELLHGCRTVTTKSGKEALVLATEINPDLIILDIIMPNMDGFSFLQKLEANPQIAHIPVILLTSRADLTEPQAIAKLKVKGAIAKPFYPLKIFSEICRILGW
ncbi:MULTISPECIES: response regulator [Pseudanabaena]|uniref:Response regulator receiver protein n=2 Tax=Pseudanabaena TaxID=1152 RepID=L8N013_9CYAN|nr:MULTISPECIES: response regulator [Pseudanabaena]ELS31588.1 response regulator receiver protein [Pseudanabaena biceps PCC 7429]MDG3496162.1 response regulator [Pseudanabaena catenata USMAC16]